MGFFPCRLTMSFLFFCPHSTPFSYHFLLMIIPPPSPKASLAYTHITHFGLYAYWLYILFNVFSLRFSGVIMRFYFLLCMLLICGHLDFLNSYWCSCHMLFSFVIQIFWILGDNFFLSDRLFCCHSDFWILNENVFFSCHIFFFLCHSDFLKLQWSLLLVLFVIQIFWNLNDNFFPYKEIIFRGYNFLPK